MKIGADPEFVCTDRKGTFLPANLINRGSGGFGCDGCSEVGEIRPQISPKAMDTVANIGAMNKEACGLQQLIKKEDILLYAGHYKHNHPIGGHIHLSEVTIEDPENFYYYIEKIVGTLANIIDDPDEMERRKGSGYGQGYRMQGTNYIEYRSPGSWLLSPCTAFANIWLSEAVSILYNNNDLDLMDDFIPTQEGIIAFAEAAPIITDKRLFIRSVDKLFNSTPIDWNVPFVYNWV